MKYRSYNSELIIAASLIVNVFNDIVIDRRKHKIDRDFSIPITFDEIVQQKIEIPCILGDRSIILKSLENEPGRYKLPLIIIQNKSLKTDPERMCDLHADVFYQQDSSFSKLDKSDKLYSSYDISKRRAQPVIIDYDLTIITKYKEDLDQIISNWIVHFRPDIYLKWWHPRIKTEPLTSQLTWAHSLSFDLPIEYNPQNIFTYKSTTSFSFKSWMFPGMDIYDEKPFDSEKGIIKSFKFFTNRSNKHHQDENFDKESVDQRDEDDVYVFGDIRNESQGSNESQDSFIRNESIGSLRFFSVNDEQDFVYDGKDESGLKNAKYAMNNIFNYNYHQISNDTVIDQMKHNSDIGDFFSIKDRDLVNNWDKYQNFLINDSSIYPDNKSIFKAVYFKGGFDEKSMLINPPSGDFLFNYFYKTYNNKKAKAELGNSLLEYSNVKVTYDIESKDLKIESKNELLYYDYEMRNIFNSENGVQHEVMLRSKVFHDKVVELLIHKEYDKNFKENVKNSNIITNNIRLINGNFGLRGISFLIGEQAKLSERTKILTLLKSLKKTLKIVKVLSNKYRIEIKDSRYKNYLKEKSIDHIPFNSLNLVFNGFKEGYYYKVLMNNYLYIVLKINSEDENDYEIFDMNKFIPLSFISMSAPLFEITIPESKMLLGINVFMKY